MFISVVLPKVFEEAAADSKFLARVKRRAAKNFKWTHILCLEKVVLLAYWLYTFDRVEDALDVCRFLAQAQFDGDLRHWWYIQSALILQSRILKAKGLTQEADNCLDRVRSIGDDAYRLDGLALHRYERNVDHALEDATKFSKPNEIAWRMFVVIELSFLLEMNSSPALLVTELEEKLSANLERLKLLAEK